MWCVCACLLVCCEHTCDELTSECTALQRTDGWTDGALVVAFVRLWIRGAGWACPVLLLLLLLLFLLCLGPDPRTDTPPTIPCAHASTVSVCNPPPTKHATGAPQRKRKQAATIAPACLSVCLSVCLPRHDHRTHSKQTHFVAHAVVLHLAVVVGSWCAVVLCVDPCSHAVLCAHRPRCCMLMRFCVCVCVCVFTCQWHSMSSVNERTSVSSLCVQCVCVQCVCFVCGALIVCDRQVTVCVE